MCCYFGTLAIYGTVFAEYNGIICLGVEVVSLTSHGHVETDFHCGKVSVLNICCCGNE